VVNTPNPKIPTLKFIWSAIKPRRKGVPPNPKITPMETITPVVIDRSERGANLEMAAIPTGKKARERVP
jgi:hypothetical protein